MLKIGQKVKVDGHNGIIVDEFRGKLPTMYLIDFGCDVAVEGIGVIGKFNKCWYYKSSLKIYETYESNGSIEVMMDA